MDWVGKKCFGFDFGFGFGFGRDLGIGIGIGRDLFPVPGCGLLIWWMVGMGGHSCLRVELRVESWELRIG